MALDGITATALSEELDRRLAGSRVDRIMQPDRYTIVLTFYDGHRQEQLTISANPSLPAIYPGRPDQPNPQIAPSFCMMLRKYLQGATLTAIDTPPYERIFRLHFQALDEYHDRVEKCLIAELINRRTNLILLNAAGNIHNAIIHVDHSINRVREILPAHPYQLPPALDKLTPEEWLSSLESGTPFPSHLDNLHIEQALLTLILGLSPFPARTIIAGCGLDPRLRLQELSPAQKTQLADALAQQLQKVAMRQWQPTLYYSSADAKIPLDFYALSLPTPLRKEPLTSIAQAMTIFSNSQRESNRLEQKRQHLRRLLNQELEAVSRKAELHRQDLAEGEKADKFQRCGELILSNLRQYRPNARTMTAIDYYDPDQKLIEIPLQEQLSSGPANADRYFRRANKAKSKLKIGSQLLAIAERNLSWLRSLQTALDTAAEVTDLEAIREEFRHYRQSSKSAFVAAQLRGTTDQPECRPNHKQAETESRPVNLNPGKPGKKKPNRPPQAKKPKQRSRSTDQPLPPRRYLSSDGLLITVGRNNIQNDRLTLRQAAKDDLWLHVKDAPGTHVIISHSQEEIPDRTIEEAAGIAAWFSRKAGSLAKTAVDFCPIRNVRKPRGAHPGHVIYDDYTTILVEPLDPGTLQKPQDS
jgi:predicted ribosome quality control (RQC) complex YloA/Tae2 family protein